MTAQQRKSIITKSIEQRFQDFRLEPNWDTESESQTIRIAIEIDEIDCENAKNLEQNRDVLNKFAFVYTQNAIPNFQTTKDIVILDITLNKADTSFTVNIASDASSWLAYLTDYNLYNEIITFYNRENPENSIPLLYESFILISSYRNYHSFEPYASLQSSLPDQQIRDIMKRENAKSINAGEQQEPSIFNIVRLKVAEAHYNMNDSRNFAECEEEANKLPFMLDINKKLKLINLQFKVRLKDKRNWSYAFEFIDVKRNKVIKNINSLSSGQKAIIHLIFEAYGRGSFKGGVVIIDEPEIHLHYQFQKEYLLVVDEINRYQNSQYILVTHSESLISANTIRTVKRLFLDDNNHTVLRSPKLTTEQQTLIKILDNSRSTYAFFANKVILVEGDTDRYLFKAVLNILYPELNQEIAILDIQGKGNYEKWKTFFEAFGLKVYFICDFDNGVLNANPIM
jgi:predicted ATP-dependent endonuclease of OLD family